MAVLPLPITEKFCLFVETSSFIRLTPARRILIVAVRISAVNQTTVTDNDWQNFILSTYEWYQAYLTDVAFRTP
jgi:hypothetical protein